jgi:hypothetical protein
VVWAGVGRGTPGGVGPAAAAPKLAAAHAAAAASSRIVRPPRLTRAEMMFVRRGTFNLTLIVNNVCGLEASFPGPIIIFSLRSRNIRHLRPQKVFYPYRILVDLHTNPAG